MCYSYLFLQLEFLLLPVIFVFATLHDNESVVEHHLRN